MRATFLKAKHIMKLTSIYVSMMVSGLTLPNVNYCVEIKHQALIIEKNFKLDSILIQKSNKEVATFDEITLKNSTLLITNLGLTIQNSLFFNSTVCTHGTKIERLAFISVTWVTNSKLSVKQFGNLLLLNCSFLNLTNTLDHSLVLIRNVHNSIFIHCHVKKNIGPFITIKICSYVLIFHTNFIHCTVNSPGRNGPERVGLICFIKINNIFMKRSSFLNVKSLGITMLDAKIVTLANNVFINCSCPVCVSIKDQSTIPLMVHTLSWQVI